MSELCSLNAAVGSDSPGGGVLPYISDIGMCGPKGYDWVDYRREFKEVLKCFSKQNQVRTVRVWAQLHKKNLKITWEFLQLFPVFW